MEFKVQILKINAYLCTAEQTVWAKAYASALDLRLNAPSRGIQSCRTAQPGLCMSSMNAVNKNSMLLGLVSINSVCLLQSCKLIQVMKEKSV